MPNKKQEVKTVLRSAGDVPVDEKRRSVVFKDGVRAIFHNVKWFNPEGSFLRIGCDEGYILMNTDNILYMKVKENERNTDWK